MDINEATRLLAGAGMRVTPVDDVRLQTSGGEVLVRTRIKREPTPADVESHVRRLRGAERALIHVDVASPSLLAVAATNKKVVLVDGSKSTVWYDTTPIAIEEPIQQKRPVRKGPPPFAKFAALRLLMLVKEPMTQTQLANALGVSQPAISAALGGLREHTVRKPEGWTVKDRSEAFEYYLDGYPGPGGITTYWWSDRSLAEQATSVMKVLPAALSGDLAARRINAWRLPEHVTLYAGSGTDPAELGFAMSNSDDYSLSLTIPSDRTIMRMTQVSKGSCLADLVTVANDVIRTGTTGDQAEAAWKLILEA